MRVRFTANFDWRPRRQVIFAFKASDEPITVKRACAEAAIAAGAAVEVTPSSSMPAGEPPNEGAPYPE